MTDDDGTRGPSRRADWSPDAPAPSGSRWAVQPYSVAGSPVPARPVPRPRDDAPTSRPADEVAPGWTATSVRPPVDDALASGPRRFDRDGAADRSAATGPTDDEGRDQDRRTAYPGARDLRAATQLGRRPNIVLAGFGGVVLIVAATVVGALLDTVLGNGISYATLVALCIGGLAAALLTRKSDLLSVVVAPPIVYTVVAGVSLLLSGSDLSVTSLATYAVSGFPAIALATGITALVAGLRLVTTRADERP